MPPIHQPLHPSILPLLNPQYIKFHETHLQYIPPDDQTPWTSSIRTAPKPFPPTESPLTKTASTQDLTLDNFSIRVFTPELDPTNNNPAPDPGWPVFLWFHGGGWAIGGLADGNDLCTLICHTARCVVVTVGYRLAPEHPYPAAIEDAIAALQYIHSPEGSQSLSIDPARIAIGGTSAGGNIAAVLAMKASQLNPPIKIRFQLLVLPVIDNMASVEGVWKENRFAPWLTPARMEWYRGMYLPRERDRVEWDASPNFAPEGLLARSPRTWIAVAGVDLLAAEGKEYARLLRRAWEGEGKRDREGGVGVRVKAYEGATHSLLSMSGVLDQGTELLRDCAGEVAEGFSLL
ncbi:AB hydrolase superfamily protein [Aspergillus cavernicola]|uniref:AB hydrolase superfamily protein n=1 Tax=Aspergillus cavernicola TaxID=176166 RepID=A0ABR4ILL1_9EURO